jgi:hypothetical protein
MQRERAMIPVVAILAECVQTGAHNQPFGKDGNCPSIDRVPPGG